MAIMRRCCCFNDTRSGTMASAIHTLIYTIVSLALAGWGFAVWNLPRTASIVITMFYIEFVAYGLVLVTSILAIVGTAQDNAGLLVPYLVCLPLMMVVEGASYIVWLALLGFAAIVLILPFIIFLIFLGVNICCLMCAISQYQELKAGRGRIGDIAAANTTTTVIMTGQPVMTQAPPGVFVVSSQQQQQQMVVQQHGQPQMQAYSAYGHAAPPPAYDQQQIGHTQPGQPWQPNAPVYDKA